MTVGLVFVYVFFIMFIVANPKGFAQDNKTREKVVISEVVEIKGVESEGEAQLLRCWSWNARARCCMILLLVMQKCRARSANGHAIYIRWNAA